MTTTEHVVMTLTFIGAIVVVVGLVFAVLVGLRFTAQVLALVLSLILEAVDKVRTPKEPIAKVKSRRKGTVWVVDTIDPDGTLHVHNEADPQERRRITLGEMDKYFRRVR